MNRILKYRSSLKEAIPLISLILALNLIFLGVGTYITISRIFLTIFIYLTSTILAVFIKKIYYLFYVIIILPLACLITIFDFSYLIMNFIPSLIISFFFGLSLDKKFDKYLTILISIVIMFIFTILGIMIVNFIYDVDIIDLLLSLFNLDENEVFLANLDLVIYLYNFIIIFLTYLFIKYEVKKFNLEFISFKKSTLYLVIINFLFVIISIILFIFNINDYLSIFVITSLVIGVFVVNEDLKKKDRLNYLIVFGVSFFISLTLFFVISAYIQNLNTTIFYLIPTIILSIYYLIEISLINFKKKEIS